MSSGTVNVDLSNRIGSPMQALLACVKPYRGVVTVACLAVLASSLLLLLASLGIRDLIDSGFKYYGLYGINRTALVVVTGVASFASIAYVRDYSIFWLGEHVAADLRQKIYEKILALSPDFFEIAKAGDLLSRLVGDVGVLQGFIGANLFRGIRSLLAFVGAMVLIMATSATLAAIVAGLVVVVALPLLLIATGERRLSAAAQASMGELNSYVEESICAICTIQSFVHEPASRLQLRSLLENGVKISLRHARWHAMLVAIGFTLGILALTLCVWLGTWEVAAHERTAGELLSFLFYAALVATSGGTLVEVWSDFQRAAGAMERVLDLLNQAPRITARAVVAPLPTPAQGRIEFADVDFHYPTPRDRAALRDFSISIAAGETIALVGPSGAGKSTILHLLTRFYDPSAGTVRVDGIDIRDVDPAELRRQIGLVPQDPIIFGANVWENIRFGRPDATDAEVIAAADAATAMEFLERLPDGLDTFLGEKGVRLSGGQKQRLALARVILKDPRILLLDEATSALDAESEQLVQQALARLSVGRTTITVAHRLATVRRADRILVMQNGELIANNTHKALLSESSLYRRFAKLQFMSDAA